jgi:hypothetical protein
VTATPLEIRLELPSVIMTRAAPDALEPAVAEAVTSLCTQLGLPLVPAVALGEPAVGRPARLFVERRAVPMATQTFVAAGLTVGPDRLPPPQTDGAGNAERVTDWLVRLAGSDVAPDAIAEFAACLVEGALLEQPERLAGETLPTAYAGDAPPDGLDAVLRSLLSRGISVAEREVVLARVAAGHRLGLAIEETAEILGARLRPPRVRIHVAPDDAAAYGLEPATCPEAPVEALPGTPEAALINAYAGELVAVAGIPMPMLEWRIDSDLRPRTVAVAVNSLRGLPQPLVPGSEQWNGRTGDMRASALDAVLRTILGQADRILDLDDVEARLGALGSDLPSLAGMVRTRLTSAQIAIVLRGLIREGVPVGNLAEILERALDYDSVPLDPAEHRLLDDRLPVPPGREADLGDLEEYVRRHLRTVITSRHTGAGGVLAVFRPDPELEVQACALSGDEPEAEAIRDAVRELAIAHWRKAPVVVTARGGRRAFLRLLREELPGLAILDEAEIADGTIIDELGVVGAVVSR